MFGRDLPKSCYLLLPAQDSIIKEEHNVLPSHTTSRSCSAQQPAAESALWTMVSTMSQTLPG